jgi:hypothetical protein
LAVSAAVRRWGVGRMMSGQFGGAFSASRRSGREAVREGGRRMRMEEGDSGVALRREEYTERRPSGMIRRISARASSVSCGMSAVVDEVKVKRAVRGICGWCSK